MKHNNPDYEYYLLWKPNGVLKIASGWEYHEDAVEALNELGTMGVYRRSHLADIGLSPERDKDWEQDAITKEQEVKIIEKAIEDLGPNSYLGPWLLCGLGTIERNIRADMLLEPIKGAI